MLVNWGTVLRIARLRTHVSQKRDPINSHNPPHTPTLWTRLSRCVVPRKLSG